MDNLLGNSEIVIQTSPPLRQYYLFVFTLILLILSTLGNGFLIFLFIWNKHLRKNKALWLILLLTITNFTASFLSFPYLIYCLLLWNSAALYFDPVFIGVSTLPLIFGFKMNLATAIVIAIDRIQALKFPVWYRSKSHKLQIFLTLGFGSLMGIADISFELLTYNFSLRQFDCPAIGCFLNQSFTTYWGSSNLALILISLILTLWVVAEIRKLAKATKLVQFHRTKFFKNYSDTKDANRLSVGILVTSLIFIFIPSFAVGINKIFETEMFKKFGPFYTMGLTLGSVSNSMLYVTLHVGIRRAAFIWRKPWSLNHSSNTGL